MPTETPQAASGFGLLRVAWGAWEGSGHHPARKTPLNHRDRPRRHDKNAPRDGKSHPEILSPRVGFDMSARAFDMSARAFDMSAQHADF